MDEKAELGIYTVIVFFTLLASAFLLKASGIITINLITFSDLDSWLALLFSTNLVLLALVFPIPLAIISALTHFKEKMEVFAVALIGAIPAATISLAVFGISFEKILLAIFLLAGLVVLIEVSFMKKKELKTLVTFRTAAHSAKSAGIIMAIGLLFAAGSIAYANNDANVKIFGEKVMELTFNQKQGTQDLTGALADSLIANQKQTVGAIMQSDQFTRLTEKTDPDVQAFVLSMIGLRDQINSPQTRQKVIDEMRKQQASGSGSQPITFEFLRRQSPMIGLMADYLWLINTFGILSLAMFVLNLFISNLAGAYAALIRRAIEATGSGEKDE